MARSSGNKQVLTIEGRQLQLSKLEKVLYPASRFTKAQIIDYYIRVAPYLLPHLKGRPVTLKRYPDGITGEHFYEKDAPSFTPEWVKTFTVPRRSGASDINFILINDLPTLVWSANLANLEIHPFLHRAPKIDTPTLIAFDVDPGAGADLLTCCQVALLLKDVFDRLKMKSFAKVSGSKGIQVYVPLDTPVTYAVTQPFAKTIAELLEQQHPKLIVSKMPKALRSGKVFIDWSQNADHKTTVGVYSLRAKRERPYVSTLITWEESREALDGQDRTLLDFQPEAALKRFEELGDLFAPVLNLKQRLPKEFMSSLANGAVVPPRGKFPRSLKDYEGKRNFASTPEPVATVPRRSSQGGRRRFVIQKHAASHLHYDLRLEMHDVLKSWAVPKGMACTLKDRRLAMATEDHPLDYLDFEGTIPEGQYGAGTVMVWDIGTYELIEGSYYKSKLRFYLTGKKLKGEWTLKRDSSKGPGAWVLRKVGKPMKPISPKRDDVSAVTGRAMGKITEENTRQWQSKPGGTPTAAVVRSETSIDLEKLPKAQMKFIEPMLANLVGTLPEGPQQQYEIKFDGYRAIAIRDDKVRLLSRRSNVLNDRIRPIARALEAIEPGTIVDGEVVALD